MEKGKTREIKQHQEGKKLGVFRIKIEGITLIALVVTIVVLIILATISINSVLGENGIIKRTEATKREHEISKSRENLSLTLKNAEIEKRVNKKYDQGEFLNDFILGELPDAKIKENIVIIEGNAFELDRSVPKIGKYVGKENELIFPDMIVNTVVAEDNRTATITIKAKEEINGIHKIEIWQEGYIIKEYTYENQKDQIIEEFITKQNGKYIIKVYAKLIDSEKTEVEGLTTSVIYNPDGNEEYKKEHEVSLKAQDELEGIRGIKYQWLQTTIEPGEDTFVEEVENGETVKKNGLTGTWYLWTLLETESGKTNIGRSEGFCFDNQGPTVTLTSIPISESSFTLNATGKDNHTKIAKYDFYVNNKLVKSIETEEEAATYQVTGVSTGTTSCYVIVTDILGNETKKSITANTKLYTWEVYGVTEIKEYKFVEKGRGTSSFQVGQTCTGCYSGPTINQETGAVTFSYSYSGNQYIGDRSGFWRRSRRILL